MVIGRCTGRCTHPGSQLASSVEFAAASGLSPAPVEELIGFHIAFGKTVPDISLNAVANLGTPSAASTAPCAPVTPCARAPR